MGCRRVCEHEWLLRVVEIWTPFWLHGCLHGLDSTRCWKNCSEVSIRIGTTAWQSYWRFVSRGSVIHNHVCINFNSTKEGGEDFESFLWVSWADKWHIKPNQHLNVQVWVIVPTYLRKKLSCFFFLKTQNPRSYKILIPGENMSLTMCSVLCCSGGFCLNLI